MFRNIIAKTKTSTVTEVWSKNLFSWRLRKVRKSKIHVTYSQILAKEKKVMIIVRKYYQKRKREWFLSPNITKKEKGNDSCPQIKSKEFNKINLVLLTFHILQKFNNTKAARHSSQCNVEFLAAPVPKPFGQNHFSITASVPRKC